MTSFFFGSKQKSAIKRYSAVHARTLSIESLESRELLSVTTGLLDANDCASAAALYSECPISENANLIDITELTAENLRAAIDQASQTPEDDVILVHTTADSNTISLNGSALVVDVNSDQYGSIIIAGYGDSLLTISNTEENVALIVSGNVYFDGVAFLAQEALGRSFQTDNLVVVADGASASFSHSMWTVENVAIASTGTPTGGAQSALSAGDNIEPTGFHPESTHTYNTTLQISGTKYAFIAGLTLSDYNQLQNWTINQRTISGDFIDAEKSGKNDSNLCWMGVASNILWYTGWANSLVQNEYGYESFYSEDDVFRYFADHCVNHGGLTYDALVWFFTGESQSWNTYGSVDVKKEGGGFYQDLEVENPRALYSIGNVYSAYTLSYITDCLQNNYGIELTIQFYSHSGGHSLYAHSITAWGYVYDTSYSTDDPEYYQGIFVSDSDNSRSGAKAPNSIRLVDLAWDDSRWQYQLFNYGYNSYDIYLTQYTSLAPIGPYLEALPVPTLSVAAEGSNSVSVTVGEVENASFYTVQYSRNEDFSDAASVRVNSGTTTINNLCANTTYYFRALASGAGLYASLDYSETQSATTYTPVSAVVVNGNKVSVSWGDDNTMADSIRYRAVGAASWTTKALKSGVTNFTFNGSVGVNYEIEILLDQQENNVIAASATILDQPKLKVDKNAIRDDSFQVEVTNYAAKNLATEATQAILTVNGVQTTLDIENQQGECNLANGGKATFANGVFTFSEMASATSYKVQITFTNGSSSQSASVTVKTTKAPYLTPNIVSAVAVSDSSVVVRWEASCGKGSTTEANKYTVQYSLDGNKWTNATTSATGGSYTIQRLKGGVEYQVRVFATKDSAFEASAPSVALPAQTLTLPKIAAVKNSVTDDSFSVNVTNYQNSNLDKATTLNVKSDKFGEAALALQNGTGSAVFSNGMTAAFENGVLTFTDAPSATQQKIQINFSDGVCTTAWSQALTIKTAKAAYNQPILSSPAAASGTNVSVKWAQVYGKNSTTVTAQSYTVQYSTDGVKWKNASTRVVGTNFTITNLLPNTGYLVAVIANKDSLFNASQPSESLFVTTGN